MRKKIQITIDGDCATIAIDGELQQNVRSYSLIHHAGCAPKFKLERDVMIGSPTTTFYEIETLIMEKKQ